MWKRNYRANGVDTHMKYVTVLFYLYNKTSQKHTPTLFKWVRQYNIDRLSCVCPIFTSSDHQCTLTFKKNDKNDNKKTRKKQKKTQDKNTEKHTKKPPPETPLNKNTINHGNHDAPAE